MKNSTQQTITNIRLASACQFITKLLDELKKQNPESFYDTRLEIASADFLKQMEDAGVIKS